MERRYGLRAAVGGPAALLVVLALAGAERPRAEEGVAAPVAAAVVYPSGAEVLRRAEVELAAGVQRLVLDGLPEHLDPASLRLRLRPGGGADILGFSLRKVPEADPTGRRERELVAVIEELEERIRREEDRAQAARLQLRFLERLGEMAAKAADRDLWQGRPDPDSWRRSWEALGTGAIETLELLRASEARKRRLERELEARRRELEAVRTGMRGRTRLVVEIEAEEPGPVALEVRHFVPDAGWEPVYEVELRTRKGEVVVDRRARVWQRTGEDWRGVELRLASVRPRAVLAPPELEPWYVDVREPEAGVGEGKMGAALAPPAPDIAILGPIDSFPAASFSAAERVDLPADGSARILRLARRRFDAEVVVEVAPKQDPVAYVTARFVYADDTPLLPGPARLVRDGAYVGESRLGPTPPGAELRLGFGADERIDVEHRFDLERKSEEGLFDGYRRIERRWLTRIRNGYRSPMTIVLYDRMPVPQDERVAVELLADSTPPTARDVGERRGVLAWRYRYEPGEEKRIRFGFAVTFPRELELEGL